MKMLRFREAFQNLGTTLLKALHRLGLRLVSHSTMAANSSKLGQYANAHALCITTVSLMLDFKNSTSLKHQHSHWISGLWLLLLALTPLVTSNALAAEATAVENSRQSITEAISERTALWRLTALKLPSREQVDIEFSEVQVFSPDSALVTEKNGKFIRRTREAIRVFRGQPTAPTNSDAVVILVYRANGNLQGRWHASQGDYELVMHAEDAQLRVLEATSLEATNNPFLNDQVFVPQNDPMLPTPRSMLESQKANVMTPANLAPGDLYTATIAIDTDYELVEQLGSIGDVSAYMASLFAYLNTTYESEIDTRLLIGDQIIPATADDDPYNSWASCAARLSEVETRYGGNTSINRALLAHFSPSGGNCGIAYSSIPTSSAINTGGVLCDANYGFSVNNITASAPNSSTPISSSWDAIVAAHELGHNFNSPHTHCYGNLNGSGFTDASDPVDSCYVSETPDAGGVNSCASSTAQLPGAGSLTGGNIGGGDGTIMSYCHLLSGGLSNISRSFGESHAEGVSASRVSERMARAVQKAYGYSSSCIATTSSSTPTTYDLTVVRAGAASGTVSSAPSGIDCGSTCTQNFAVDTSVTLTASPSVGSEFSGWSGDCSGTDSCVVTMSTNRSVTASFTSIPAPALGDAVDAPWLTWTTGGDATWLGQTVEFYTTGANDDAAQAGNISDSQSSRITTEVTGSGVLSFYWKVSSESNYDYLSVWVDGERQNRISGSVGWSEVTLNIEGSGGHTVQWQYDKDASVSSGDDTGWVDLVTWTLPPDPPSLASVATAQTSTTLASATLSFSAASSGGTPETYTATCSPQAASRKAAQNVSLTGDVLTQEVGLALSGPSLEARESFAALHTSRQFKDQGLRCGTESMQPRASDINYGDDPAPQNLAADCTNYFTAINSSYAPLTGADYVIPVVFHVIYRSDNVGYVSSQRIADQIDVLNEDFSGYSGAGFNTSVQFELTEIKYYQNDTAFQDSLAGSYKAQIASDQSQYLNIFTNDAGGGGVLGYATLPDGAAGASGDGIVMLHETIGGRNNGYGSFDEGRTLVHEVGHYLGLQHTFNPSGACESNTYSAGDLLVDTPAQFNADYGSASSDCGATSAFNNFMNYSYDDYMYTFTSEQTNRMICSLTSYRSSAYTISYDNGPPVSATGTTSPLIVSGLTAGTTYACSVAATIGTNESGNSASITIIAGDADGDGALDLDDAFPTDPTETVDSDGDGLGNNLEGTLGTDINNVDTDGDDYSDYDEYTEGTDPLDANDYPNTSGLPIWLLYEATQP
jgi:hypothetical protein